MWGNNDSTMQSEGGYMDTSANTSSSFTGTKSNLNRGQSCVPVMIAHLNRYGDNLSIWGVPTRHITFVAVVRNIETLSTKVNFEFEDETGAIRGVKWLDAETTSYESPVQVNSYARVHGSMRSQNNENFVLVTNIQTLKHLNELFSHLMEVTVVGLEGEKMMSTVVQNDLAFVNNSVNARSSSDMTDCPFGLNNEQAMVYNIIKNGEPEYGAQRHEIKSQVPPHFVSEVDQILEFLSSEGHIYTTRTDDHFKII